MKSRTALDLVAEAKAMIDNLTVEQVQQEIRDETALILDVRDLNERAQAGAIPGSKHVPRGMLEFFADPSNPFHQEFMQPERRIIVHCAFGGRSALAAKTLIDLGYTNVAHLEAGFNGWRDAGGAIEKV